MNTRTLDRHNPKWRIAAALAIALVAIFSLVVACSSEPEPTATATAAAPTPTSTPILTAAPELMLSMADFVSDETTTGQDLIDRLTGEQTACIRTAFGEPIFNIILVTPLLIGGTDPSASAPLYGCLQQEEVVLIGTAFIDARAGGRSEESRERIRNQALEHPEVIYAPLGLSPEGQQIDHPPEVHEFALQFYECQTDQEKVQSFITVWEGLTTSAAITGSDIVRILNDSEITCFREYFGDERYEAFLGELVNSGDLGSHAMHEACFMPETASQLYVRVVELQIGELREETRSCMAGFALEHEHFVDALILTTVERMTELSQDEFVELARDGQTVYECMTPEELWAFQEPSYSAYSAS